MMKTRMIPVTEHKTKFISKVNKNHMRNKYRKSNKVVRFPENKIHQDTCCLEQTFCEMTDNSFPNRKTKNDRENEESLASKTKRCQRHDSKKKKKNDKDENCEPCVLLNDISDTKKHTKSGKKDRDKKKKLSTKVVAVASHEEKCIEKLRRKKTTEKMTVRDDKEKQIPSCITSTKKKKSLSSTSSSFLPCEGTVEKVKKRKGGRVSSDGICCPRSTSSIATGSFDGPKLDGGTVKSVDGNNSMKSSKLAELLSENSMIDLIKPRNVQQVLEKTTENKSISSGQRYRGESSYSSSKSPEEKEGEEERKRLSSLTVGRKSRSNGSTSSDLSSTTSSKTGRINSTKKAKISSSKKRLSSNRIKEQELEPVKVESSYQCLSKKDDKGIIIKPCTLSYEISSSSRKASTTGGKSAKKDQRLKEKRYTLQNDSSSTNTSIASKVEDIIQNLETENKSLMIRPPIKSIEKFIVEKKKVPRMSSDIVSLDRPMRTRRSLQRMRFPQWSKRWNVSPSLISKKTKSLQKLSPSSSIASDTSENAASEDNILWYLQPTSKRKIEQDPVERCTMEMIFFDR